MSKEFQEEVGNQESMSLAHLGIGKKARVVDMQGGWSSHKRLLSMGVGPGANVEMISVHPLHGPVVIKVEGSQMAIGRGLAKKVMVDEI